MCVCVTDAGQLSNLEAKLKVSSFVMAAQEFNLNLNEGNSLSNFPTQSLITKLAVNGATEEAGRGGGVWEDEGQARISRQFNEKIFLCENFRFYDTLNIVLRFLPFTNKKGSGIKGNILVKLSSYSIRP